MENGHEILKSPKTAVLSEALRLCRLDLDREKGKALQHSMDAIVTAAQQLRDVSDCSQYLQGGLLSQLYRKGENGTGRWATHEQASGMTWVRYCETVLNRNPRSAAFLIRFYEKAVQFGLSIEKLEELGWWKARRMLQVVTHDTLEEWLDKARAAPTTRAFAEAVRATSVRRKAGREPMRDLRFKVTDEQRENILEGLEEARGVAARSNPGTAAKLPDAALLDYMVTDWRSNHYDKKNQSLAWCIRQLERVFGVKLAVELTKEGA